MGLGNGSSKINWKVDSYKRQLIAMMVWLVILAALWGVSGALLKAEFNHGGSGAQLWFACIVGPLGVWIRWFLARLNGRGLGRAGLFKWIPFGTLIANVSAACIMAALASVKKAVNFHNFIYLVIQSHHFSLSCFVPKLMVVGSVMIRTFIFFVKLD